MYVSAKCSRAVAGLRKSVANRDNGVSNRPHEVGQGSSRGRSSLSFSADGEPKSKLGGMMSTLLAGPDTNSSK